MNAKNRKNQLSFYQPALIGIDKRLIQARNLNRIAALKNVVFNNPHYYLSFQPATEDEVELQYDYFLERRELVIIYTGGFGNGLAVPFID